MRNAYEIRCIVKPLPQIENMKSKLLILITLTSLIISCIKRPKFVNEFEKNKNKYEYQSTITELGKLADTTYTNSTDLKSIMDFKTIDLNGSIKSISMETAIQQYVSNTKNNKPEFYPIFEIKNTSKVILPVFGQGLWGRIWGKVMLDKESMKVIKIEFDHRSETPGIGGNINDSIFNHQFMGSTAYLTKNDYSLYQSDEIIIEGKQRIDGISGATITSKGAIEMLNSDLMKYKEYLH